MLLGENVVKIEPSKTVLIMPAISVGNVGQLAADLLITNFKLDYVGRVNGHDCLLPVAGNDPFGGDQLCTSLMAYYSEDLKLLVFQQRSDFLREKKKEYLQRLLSWLKECRFKCAFVLTSAFAHERTDVQMTENPLQYRLTSAAAVCLSNSKTGDCIATRMPWPLSSDVQKEPNDKRILPGSGIAQSLYKSCLQDDIPLVVVSKYCMEGDNRMDSCQVASACAALLGLSEVPKKWILPKSWVTQDDPM